MLYPPPSTKFHPNPLSSLKRHGDAQAFPPHMVLFYASCAKTQIYSLSIYMSLHIHLLQV